MAPPQSRPTKVFSTCKRVLKWTFVIALVYISILVVGLIPVNNNFVQSENGVTLYVVSNAVHADIIVPATTSVIDWNKTFRETTFGGDIANKSHVAFGWGDRGFFLETETWDDLKLSTAANALLLPSNSCVHVSFTRPEIYVDATSITISLEQYENLVEFINSSFKTDADGNYVQIPGYAYSNTDAFFDAHGRYHILNTCNSWVGRALKFSGVRVPFLSPLPKSPMIYIEPN